MGTRQHRTGQPRSTEDLIDALAFEIVSGRMQPGAKLLPELELAGSYGLSRTAVREALKLLSEKGLIVSKRRVGTLVQPKYKWNILDPRVLGWIGAQPHDPELEASVLEVRRALEPEAASLAASRATLAEIAAIGETVDKMRAANRRSDFLGADAEFHQRVMAASHNPVFVQLSRSLQAAIEHVLLLTSEAVEDLSPALQLHTEVLTAIRRQNPDEARDAMGRIIARAIEDLAKRENTAHPSEGANGWRPVG